MKISSDEELLLEKMTNVVVHNALHLPILGYAFNEAGEKVLIKRVDRRQKNCPSCDERYGADTPYNV